MSKNAQDKTGRRSFLKFGAAGVGAAAAVGSVGVAVNHALTPETSTMVVRPARHGVEEPDEHFDELLGLSQGMRLGPYEIERVALRDGAVRVEANAGKTRFRVDILRRSRSPRGLGETADYSLYLCNQGTGNRRTDETCGIGVLAMANYLDQIRPSAPEGLLDFRSRRKQFPVRESDRFLF